MYLHGRLWHEPLIGPRAPFSLVDHEPPTDRLDDEYPIRLTTGRRLDSYNTGVQTGRYNSPLRRPEALEISPQDGDFYKLHEGEQVRVVSRRGSVVAPVHFDPGLRPGLAFLSIHFHDQVATNDLTIDAVDPRSGTAEFKATAIRIEKYHEA
jgi:formate dehydrogenase major subunit